MFPPIRTILQSKGISNVVYVWVWRSRLALQTKTIVKKSCWMKNVSTLALLALLLSTSCGEKETVVINAFETPLRRGIVMG